MNLLYLKVESAMIANEEFALKIKSIILYLN